LGLEREECLERDCVKKTYVLGDEIIKSLAIWAAIWIEQLKR
jgi:hypothetical protein